MCSSVYVTESHFRFVWMLSLTYVFNSCLNAIWELLVFSLTDSHLPGVSNYSREIIAEIMKYTILWSTCVCMGIVFSFLSLISQINICTHQRGCLNVLHASRTNAHKPRYHSMLSVQVFFFVTCSLWWFIKKELKRALYRLKPFTIDIN